MTADGVGFSMTADDKALETKNNLQTITHHPQIDMIISDMAPDTL
jgi:hypothetical protein